MKEIVQKETEILHKKTEEVPVKDIKSDDIQSLIKDMFDVLDGKEHGVALAAPQIGVSKQIFIVASKVLENRSKDKVGIQPEGVKNEDRKKFKLVYINPKIIKTSKKTNKLEEACLSVDGYYGTVKRIDKVTIEAYDEHGVKFTKGTSGLLSQIFQHEIDHLNGILYIDHASDIKEIKTEDKTADE